MSRVNIGDGFDFDFSSLPTDRTPNPVAIKYRPPTIKTVAKLDAVSAFDAEKFPEAQAEFLAEHIGEWDAVGSKDDTPLPIKKETFLKIRDWNLLKQFREEICRSNLKVAEEQKK